MITHHSYCNTCAKGSSHVNTKIIISFHETRFFWPQCCGWVREHSVGLYSWAEYVQYPLLSHRTRTRLTIQLLCHCHSTYFVYRQEGQMQASSMFALHAVRLIRGTRQFFRWKQFLFKVFLYDSLSRYTHIVDSSCHHIVHLCFYFSKCIHSQFRNNKWLLFFFCKYISEHK